MPNYKITLEYDGTNYADAGAIPAGISVGSYFGIQTDAVACAGQDTAGNRRMTRTLNYDGTSWTTNVATLGQGRESPMSAGSASAGSVSYTHLTLPTILLV